LFDSFLPNRTNIAKLKTCVKQQRNQFLQKSPMKKNYFVLATLLLCYVPNLLSESSSDFDLDFDLNALLNTVDPSFAITFQDPGCDPLTVIEKLTLLNIPQTLQNNFYELTQPPVTRSVLDLPSLRIYQDRRRCWSFFVLPFYNQTTKMFFSKCSDRIGSYLSLTADFLANLDTQTLIPNFNLDEVFPLFGLVTLQERRLGGMFSAYTNHKAWAFGIRMPLYYLERNFFLNDQEVQAIKNALFFKESTGTAASDEEEVMTFARRHLISDKVGFGDTRLTGLYRIDGLEQDVWLGAELTIPTAVAFHKGIYGSAFCKSQPPPPFDFLALLQETTLCGATPAQEEEALATALDFATEALDKLTANVADRPLGNNGHFSIAPLLEHQYYFNDCLKLITHASFEYLFPADEHRFFIIQKNPADFVRNYNDNNQAQANLTFLSQQAINTFFPADRLCTRVSPGIIVKLSTGFYYETYHYYSMLGYDFWWQGQERLKIIQPLPPLALNKGVKPAASQSKVFGYLGGKMHLWHYVVRLGLRSDVTITNHAIGKDFTVALDIDVDF
jgi:hypothetical protein